MTISNHSQPSVNLRFILHYDAIQNYSVAPKIAVFLFLQNALKFF